MAGSSLLSVFLYKAAMEKRRHFWRNTVNTVVPIVFILIYAFTRSGFQRGGSSSSSALTSSDDSLTQTLSQDDLVEFYPTGPHVKLLYAPHNGFTEELIEQVRQKLFITHERVEHFPTVDEMERTLLFSQDFYAIAFGTNTSEAHLSYTIRTKNNNFRTGEIYSRDVYESYLKERNEYFESGFLALQYALEKSFVEIRTGLSEETLPEYQYEHVPLLGHKAQESSEIFLVSMMLAVFISVACTYLLLVPLVEEKASGMKEYLKIATPSSYWNEVAIFICTFIHLSSIAFICLIVTIMAKIWEVTAAQMVFAVVLLLLFVICTISFTFFISTLLNSVTISAIVAPICHFVPVTFASAQKRFEGPLAIFPMVGYKVGSSILHDYQNSWHSFKAGDALRADYPGNVRISLLSILIIQFFGIVVWSFLWFYISNVFPGQYGTPKHRLFLFDRTYYQKGKNKINSKGHSRFMDDNDSETKGAMEKNDHLEVVLDIKNLHKIFKTNFGTRTAVKNLSLKIYKNRITALLGHNGAGKTTTMNIITGMITRTSGRISIDGEENSNNYRQQIGFCPQHNVALGYMNCREHLKFFGRLRGITKEAAEKKANQILERVNLTDKSEEVVSHLSGGMKRRFCLANAIIGRTKLLILDEPTSGLDPESRRDIWDVLLKLKKDHTILITTHFMEEADVLGDWISIMENGELIAFGTSIFLKQHYGKGYTLKLLKKDIFQKEAVLAKISEYIAGATEKPVVEPVFAVTLPYLSIEQYAPLLRELEENMDQFGIASISITNATLEEVFLNSSSENKALEIGPSFDYDTPDAPITPRSLSGNSANPKQYQNDMKKVALSILDKCAAIYYKKSIHIKQNAHIYGFMSVLPILTTILCFLLSSSYSPIDFESVSLHHSTVAKAFVVIALNDNDRPFDVNALKNGSYFRDLDVIVVEELSIREYLAEEGRKDWNRYHDKLVAAVEFNVSERSLKMLHNNNLLHSSGIGANIGSNLLLHYYGYPQSEVTVQNSPSTRRLKVNSLTAYLFTEVIALAFMFYMLQYLQLPYLEMSSGFRQVQNINRYLYWGFTFLMDFLIHVLICVIVFFLALNMDRENLFTRAEHGQILAVLILYGMAGLLVIYIISQCVDKMDTAVTVMSYLVIVGVCGVFLLSDGYDRIRENNGWIGILHLIPEFSLKHSLRVVYENQKLTKIQALMKENSIETKNDAIELLDLDYIYCITPFVVILLTLILNEIVENIYRKEKIQEMCSKTAAFKKRCFKCSRKQLKTDDQLDSIELQSAVVDDDVDAESRLVKDMTSKEPHDFAPNTIVVNDLSKEYLSVKAVKGISFAVKRGECFGLLGMNGAGKTSTFQMITRNLAITNGDVYLNDHSIKQTSYSVYKDQFGYCPQGDSLLDFMTPFQLINYCAMMKNIHERENLINRWLTDLDILSFAHSRINECSGGTKRKVNTLLAMLCNPPIVFLDEPTTGVDPKSRHFVWNRIKTLQQQDQTIVLTSHSMDECEELCNRLTIMVAGQLRCIGFIQLLKEKYGKGFNLFLKLKSIEQESDPLKQEILERLSGELKEEHDGLLKFLMPERVQLSTLFAQMVEIKAKYDELISTFSINETSLEDIFLNFRPKPISQNSSTVDETGDRSMLKNLKKIIHL
ncbi:ATP-binding cassette sub-family A member 2-like [Uranotaenia lowii]|uniref:ATP-binding cassette sub-family A member 2-like n=1 Tax=Uranotaenia lowii TaxID=190385 RepID=UPI00247ACE82|nr:ATP-binding cassette sub-family A member 2-like [Uranotaenia lowii]